MTQSSQPARRAVHVDLPTRLSVYGLNETQLSHGNLRLEPNQRMVVSQQEPTLANRMVKLQPQTIDHLKSWIGVPDAALTHLNSQIARPVSRAFSTVSPDITANEHATMFAAGQNFVFGNSATVHPSFVPTLNDWLTKISAYVPIWLFWDVYLAAGSQLVLSPGVFFASNITVEETATIQLPGGSFSKIDCVGFKSVPVGGGGTGTGTGTGTGA